MVQVFMLTILLVAVAILLWCLRGFTRTLKQPGFVGVLMRAPDTGPAGPKQQETAQLGLTGLATTSSLSHSGKGIVGSRQGLTRPDIKVQQSTSFAGESGYQSRVIEDVA